MLRMLRFIRKKIWGYKVFHPYKLPKTHENFQTENFLNMLRTLRFVREINLRLWSHTGFLVIWNSCWRWHSSFFDISFLTHIEKCRRRKNWILSVAFWVTCQPAPACLPIRLYFLVHVCMALKRPPREVIFFFLYTFEYSGEKYKKFKNVIFKWHFRST